MKSSVTTGSWHVELLLIQVRMKVARTLKLGSILKYFNLESAQQDRRKFADLYDKYFCLVHAYTARRVADRATAEVLLQMSFRKHWSICRNMFGEGFLLALSITSVYAFLYVDDVDAWHPRAIAGGATELEEPKDQAYGDRVSAVSDPFGNNWYLATATPMAEPDH